MTAAADDFPRRRDPPLPALDRFIGCFAMFAENHLTAGLHDPPHFTQRRHHVRYGAKRVGDEHSIDGFVLERNLLGL
jgi:hypothetical protein